jgi:very-short-patch-repair endonuclease
MKYICISILKCIVTVRNNKILNTEFTYWKLILWDGLCKRLLNGLSFRLQVFIILNRELLNVISVLFIH